MENINEAIVDHIWHWKVEDNLSWEFCSKILLQDENIIISPTELKNKFLNYFKELTGVAPYTKCPKCESELIPRKGEYGKFIGCLSYPECKYTAKYISEFEAREVRKLLSEIGRESLTECPKCGSYLIVCKNNSGKFVGCSAYPDCEFVAREKVKRRTKEEIQIEREETISRLLVETGVAPYTPCPKCGKELVPRNGRYGEFIGCKGYREGCKYTVSPIKDQAAVLELIESTGYTPGMDCPDNQCNGKLRICKSDRGFFIGCTNYPLCKFMVVS